MSSHLRFLESIENMRELLRSQAPSGGASLELARRAAAALAQGRMYFESAIDADEGIRPLLTFYGMVAYAGAVALARTGRVNILEGVRGHGITHASDADSLSALRATVTGDGALGVFNDALHALQSVQLYDGNRRETVFVTTAQSDALIGHSFALRDILARVPGLRQSYERSFAEPSLTLECSLPFVNEAGPQQIDVYADGDRTADRVAALADVRRVCPWLERLICTKIYFLSEFTVFTFAFRDREGLDDGAALAPGSFHKFEIPGPLEERFAKRLGREVFSQPLDQSGGSGYNFAAPFSFGFLPPAVTLYIGAYLLSALVRYRPHVWMHALSGTVLPGRPADDRLLAVLGEFQQLCHSSFPDLVLNAILSPPPPAPAPVSNHPA